MLEPQDRRLLLESLRPPAGYVLSEGLGTTYSLDLLTLLTAPLAFTFLDWEDAEGKPVTEPLAVIEAVRRNIDKLAVFCQADRIKLPPADQKLLPYLEDAVVPVAKRGGVFHPKVWLLRFEPAREGSDEPVRYRFLCLSRNLTFDRSWDTVLCLEGVLLDHRDRAIAVSRPLGDFVAALPGLATGPVPERVTKLVDRMQDEVRRVQFELPEPFQSLAFWPLGIGAKPSDPFEGRITRALVVSPFVSDQRLRLLSEQGGDHILVARPEELAAISAKTLARFDSVRVLAEAATPEPQDGESRLAAPDVADLEGLHAKLYVLEQGWDVRVLTGSANATSKAFSGNVEFLVELGGKKGRVGIDAVLAAPAGAASFGSLLQEYKIPEARTTTDDVQRLLESQLRAAREALIEARYRAVVSTVDAGYGLTLESASPPRLISETEIRCWPITRTEAAARPLSARVDFGALSFEALTAFFAFEVTTADSGRHAREQFVLAVPLEGAPPDRRERVLRSLLKDRDRVLRLLLMLLAEEGLSAQAFIARDGAAGGARSGGSLDERGLLESLLKALARRPAQLDTINSLVRDLKCSPETRDLLPHGFEKVWALIWHVREKLQ